MKIEVNTKDYIGAIAAATTRLCDKRNKMLGVEYPIGGYVIRLHKGDEDPNSEDQSVYYSKDVKIHQVDVREATYFGTASEAFAQIAGGKVKLYDEREMPQIVHMDCFCVITETEVV